MAYIRLIRARRRQSRCKNRASPTSISLQKNCLISSLFYRAIQQMKIWRERCVTNASHCNFYSKNKSCGKVKLCLINDLRSCTTILVLNITIQIDNLEAEIQQGNDMNKIHRNSEQANVECSFQREYDKESTVTRVSSMY